MDAFPAFFPLAGRKVVVAGTGEAAEAKARLFDGSPATLVRLEGPDAFLPGAYAGASLAFIAGDELFAQAAAAAARAARVLVNVVDKPALSDFHTPAVIDRGEVVAAVGTAGSAPMLASLLRNAIESRVPEGSGRVAALLRRHQDAVRAAIPDLPLRRSFLRDALSSPAAEAAMAGEVDKADRLFVESLDAFGSGEAPGGRVRFVAGRGPADLITLRAGRVLAETDVLVVPEGVEPGILAMARRDAGRLTEAEATPEALIALVRGGRQVVRLVVAPPSPEDLRALVEAGIEVEVLLAAPGT
ncbi:NAD(P)-dependent oxidoreductase [Caulobacter mirabilis]|uniref:precorrin-2 dehydrogenase n=1 Tax=Caulobacter mirabilis TaxID=69666 RepID=A0A2D2ASW1_9CAUL|nr:NAD(P)-dependent oxidoreductase [Caulobacter mirabilis]ATQ41094.1 siroheme synthase [Caulobacter mirabilis]